MTWAYRLFTVWCFLMGLSMIAGVLVPFQGMVLGALLIVVGVLRLRSRKANKIGELKPMSGNVRMLPHPLDDE